MLDNQSKMRSMLDLLEAVDQGKKVNLNESSNEQISELSADTLRSYINKSKGDSAKYDQAGDVAHHEKGDVKLANKMYKKGDNRYHGERAAKDRLIKGALSGLDEAEGEKTMSRAAKGYEKYGKKGMMALAKAGREDAGEEKLDSIRNKYDRYDNDTKKDVTEESLNEDATGVEVHFMNSGTGQDMGVKSVQNMGITLDGAGRPVMKVSNPFSRGETLLANFDARSGGWKVDLD